MFDQLKDFINFCKIELKIEHVNIEFDEEYSENLKGECIDLDENNFLILVKLNNRNITEVAITIAHEMTHVKQYVYENLGYHLDNNDIPYHERWWEIEANENGKNFIIEYINNVK